MPKAVLLIQSRAADSEVVRQLLNHPGNGAFVVEFVASLTAALERLQRSGRRDGRTAAIAAVITELFLPDSRGISTFDALFAVAPQIPILVLIDASDEDIAALAVQHGAQDYLFKDRLDEQLLPKALRNMVERAANAEALFVEKERAQVTLNSIGDAVICADESCAVSYLNAVAENLTGWSLAAAAGRPVDEVFHIVNETTRKPVVNPMALAMREDRSVALTPNCLLIRRDGSESAIEDSAAPIHDRAGRVTGAVMVFHDVTTARAQSLKLSHLAQHDALTDLPNRSLFDDRLNQALAQAGRRRTKLAVLFLDVDRFKHVNDTAGHRGGDLLLKSVARRLLDCVRSSDTVSRWGGDEFAIVLTEIANGTDAAVAADKMLATLAGPHIVDGKELHITASIGIATYPTDGQTGEVLSKHADIAMYRAKNCGRNGVQFFKAEMNQHALERQTLETDLRHALERDEFELRYQAKVSLRTGRITGCEALLRWRHPTRRLVRPARFIRIAEESGLIVPIGRWVLREACRQARAWEAAGLAPVSVAVNVSAVELRARNFTAGVRAALDDAGLAAGHLEIEITETVLMQDEKSTAAVLRELREIGVRVALDDFGTGYSSLNHLKRLPVDTLKIDRSFIRQVTTHADDASIVGAIVRMGRSMRMRIVAEGVETLEQRLFLERQQCPEAQGFYFGRPMRAAGFAGAVSQPGPRALALR